MPLGAGRASEYAGWWGGGPLIINIASTSSISQAVYQTPSFSWENSIGDGTYPTNTFVARLAPGAVDLTGFSGSTGYEKKRWTIMMTFNLHMPAGLSSNEGIKQDTKFVGDDGDYTTNMAWVHGYNTPVRLQINWPTGASVEMPANGYDAYNDQWLTIVGSSSDTYTSYTDWAGSTSVASNYFRTAVYDTATGQLIKKQDSTGSYPMGFPSNLTTWISNAGASISTNRSDSYSWSISDTLPDTQAGCSIKVANFWVTFGKMWDPVTQKAAGQTTWLTTRPDSTIGDAEAWINGQFDGLGNTTGYGNAWSTASGMDLFTPDDTGHGMTLIANSLGNATTFGDRYSTTDIPKDES